MKKFLIVVLLLCLLVVGGIVGMALMSFNPSAYERDVVAYLQRLTGREVSVEGTTAISWNPEPTVTMQNVKISNMDKAKNPIMLSIEKVKVSIAWESLLKSPLEIKRIELTRPVLYLERLESNRANYSFPFLLDPNFQLQEMAILSDPASATTKIDTILIKDGRIGYENQITGTAFQVTGVNGTLAVDTVRGPYRFKGTGMSGKGQYAVEASVGTFQGSTPVPVTVQLSESNTRLDLKTTGNLTPVGVDKWYDGAIRYDIGRLDALLTDLNWPIPDLSAGAVAGGTATLIIAPASDMLKDFVITIGEEGKGTALTGKITRTISGKKYAYDADVSTNLLRLNQWKNYWNLLNWEWLSGEKEYPNIRFKVYANDVLAGQVGLQEVSLKGNYQNNVLTMEESQAKLPDGGKLTLTAVGKSQNPEPYLDIGLRVETPKFGEMLSQSGVDQKWAQMPFLNQKSNFIGRVVVTPKDTTI
ncbi:MAG: AsmA family protein, partial [Pseudomonadota bacterium]|nr:AsmA family protein [Pseudomonadota bacterium]